MGHAAPFAFGDDYAPAPGIDRFLCGTPSVLAMALLEVGVDQFEGVEMAALAQKGQRLCRCSSTWWRTAAPALGFSW